MTQYTADKINPMALLEFYKNENKELTYNLTIEKMVNNQYRELLNNLIKKYPELEKEVTNGSNSTQSDARRKQKQ